MENFFASLDFVIYSELMLLHFEVAKNYLLCALSPLFEAKAAKKGKKDQNRPMRAKLKKWLNDVISYY